MSARKRDVQILYDIPLALPKNCALSHVSMAVRALI